MRSIFLCENPNSIARVYPLEIQAQLKNLAGLMPDVYSKANVLKHPHGFRDVEFLFSTWGMPQMTEEEIAAVFPNLRAVFYAAGTVQAFARPFLHRGVRIFSAWGANGVPVAEYTLAQILLANTGYFHTSAIMRTGDAAAADTVRKKFPGNFDVTVGIIGAGMIGKMVIKLLKDYKINVMAYSLDLTPETANALGVQAATIEEIFANCQVVSNHLANLPQTVGMLKKAHFASMLPYATFLNTGRGAQVVEADLIDVLRERRDLMAVLDVTDPEPPEPNSPLYSLPNCILTPHIAGSIGNEVRRMSEYMAAECRRFLQGEPCQWEVTLPMLEYMA